MDCRILEPIYSEEQILNGLMMSDGIQIGFYWSMKNNFAWALLGVIITVKIPV